MIKQSHMYGTLVQIRYNQAFLFYHYHYHFIEQIIIQVGKTLYSQQPSCKDSFNDNWNALDNLNLNEIEHNSRTIYENRCQNCSIWLLDELSWGNKF